MTYFLKPVFWCIATLIFATLFYQTVDLKPKVEENFFFSSDDPQFRADKSISALFPQPPQIIISAKWNLVSEDYQNRIRQLTDELLLLPEVVAVQSLSHGPRDYQHAFKSPLWRRALISSDDRSSFVSILIKKDSIEKVISKIEMISMQLESPGNFKLMISGAPYIVEMIRRSLFRDLKVFSLIAVLVFAAAVYGLFRSLPILAGTLLSCLNASLLTLTISEWMHIKIGPLTSNLAVIVFVLTLSHIIFITFNWIHKPESEKGRDAVSEAVSLTIHPSFWSMVTQLLGFMSLFFVKATPLRQLGISGIVGTLIAFAAAYWIYPAFLRLEMISAHRKDTKAKDPFKVNVFFLKSHPRIAALILILAAAAGIGMRTLNTNPSLLSYFKKGDPLRNGLEYIDRNGGSTPLKLVVQDAGGALLDTKEAYEKMWRLHRALERDIAVGNVLSLPIILAEAKQHPLGSIIPNSWLLNLLGMPSFGEISKYFVTNDRKSTLFLLRMQEMDRVKPRLSIVNHIEDIVSANGFKPVLTGGVYLLQGKLSELVVSSILIGLILLIAIFMLIAGAIARSLRVGLAIGFSLCLIPLWTIGILGHLRIPFDIISSPGTNIAIGMGVDAMINMLFFVKRNPSASGVHRNIWFEACAGLWKPIFYSTALTCLGFGIFISSSFPPTQRFGLSVILGMLISPLAALFIFPWIAKGAK